MEKKLSTSQKSVLKKALESLSHVQLDYYTYGNNRVEVYDYASIGKMVLAQRALAELLGEDINQYLLPGESPMDIEDGDDPNDWQRFISSTETSELTPKEKKFILNTILPMLKNLGGIHDSDDASLRCAKRMIAEAAGYPELSHYRLLMEKDIKPLYYKNYEPFIDEQINSKKPS